MTESEIVQAIVEAGFEIPGSPNTPRADAAALAARLFRGPNAPVFADPERCSSCDDPISGAAGDLCCACAARG